MTRSIGDLTTRDVEPLRAADTVAGAVARVLASGLTALPVVDDAGALRGIFGEREFMRALFPGYLDSMRSAAFVARSLDQALESRACADEEIGRWMTTDHVAIGPDASDAQIAETFLHHRVSVLPVVADGHVDGVITRSDFFRALAERFVGG